MFSQSGQAQTVEVIQLVPKEQISEHIVGEIVVFSTNDGRNDRNTCAESHSRTSQGCSHASDSREILRRPSRSHKNEFQSAALKRAKPTAG